MKSESTTAIYEWQLIQAAGVRPCTTANEPQGVDTAAALAALAGFSNIIEQRSVEKFNMLYFNNPNV